MEQFDRGDIVAVFGLRPTFAQPVGGGDDVVR
jgi:hypothetical protein